MRFLKPCKFLLAVVVWAGLGNAWAATKTWVGGSPDWNTGSNWSPAGIPGEGDDVLFTTATPNCVLGGNVVVGSITFNANFSNVFNFNGYTMMVDGGTADFRSGGSFNSPAGSMLILRGSALQALHPKAGQDLPYLVHDGDNTLQIAGADLSVMGFLQLAGSLDLNGYDIATVSGGDFSIHNGHAASLIGLGGRTITVSGRTHLSGTPAANLTLSPGSGWTLAAAGPLYADRVTLGNSTASPGAGVAFRSTDNGGNTNWAFATPGTYFWNRNNAITSGILGHSHNWSAGADGSGNRPPSTSDDPFTADALGGAWTFVDNDGYTGGGYSLTTRADQLEITGRGQNLDASYSAFNGVFRSDITGDFDVTVKLLYQTSTLPQAQAGIMIADDPTNLSLGGFCALTFSPAGNLAFRWDQDGNGNLEASTTVNGLTGPIWLRMVRNGTSFLAWYRTSLAGASWTQIGTTANLTSAAANSRIGLISTAGTNSMDAFAVFDDFLGGTDFAGADYHLSFNGTGTNADANAVLGANTTVGSLDFTGFTGDFSFGSYILNVSVGNATFASGQTVTAGTGTLVFSAASGTQTFTPKSGATFPGIAKTGAGTVIVAGNALMASHLSLSAGTWNWGVSSLTHGIGSITATGGAMTFGSNTVSIASGNVDFGSLGTLNANSGNLQFIASGGTQIFTPRPGITHPALFKNAAGTLRIAGSLTVPSLSIGGGTVDFASGPVSLTATGDVSLTGGTLDVSTNAPSLSAGGNLSITGGTLTAANGSLDVDGNVTVSAGALVCPTGTFPIGGSLSISGGTFTHSSGTLLFDATAGGKDIANIGSFANLAFNGTGGGWTPTAHITATGTVTLAAGTLDISANAKTLTAGAYVQSGGTLAAQDGNLDVNGSFTLSGGSLSAPGAGTFTVSGGFSQTGGTLTANAGTITMDGTSAVNFRHQSSLSTLAFTGSGGTWTFEVGGLISVINLSAGTLNFGTGNTFPLSNLVVNGGNLDFGSSTVQLSHAAPDLSNVGNVTPGTGILEFRRTGDQYFTPKAGVTFPTILKTNTGVLYLQGSDLSANGLQVNSGGFNSSDNSLDLSLSGPLILGGGTTTLTNSDLIATGGLTVSGGTLLCPAAGRTFQFGGGITKASGATVTHNSGTLTLAGTATGQVIDVSGSGFHHVTLSGAGSSWTTASNLDIAGIFALLAGSLNLTTNGFDLAAGGLVIGGGTLTAGGASLDINGDLTVTSGTLTCPGSGETFTVRDNISHSGGSFDGNGGTITLDGTGPGGVLNVSGGFANLAINGSGGSWNVVTHPLAVSGSLTVSAGTLNSSSNSLNVSVGGNLTLAGGALIATNSAVDVNGNLSLASGTLSAPSGALAVAGNASKSAGATFTHNNGTLVLDGTSPGKTLDFASGTLHNLTVNGSGGGWTAANSNLSVAGALTLSGGTLHLGTSLTHTVGQISTSNGTLDFGSSTLVLTTGHANLSGLQTLTAGTGILEISQASGQQDLSPKSGATHPWVRKTGAATSNIGGVTLRGLEVAAGTVVVGGTLTLDGNLSLTGGTLDAQTGSLDINGDVSISGLPSLKFPAGGGGRFFHVSGSFTAAPTASLWPNSGTLTLDGTATGKILDIGPSIDNLVVNGSGGEWTATNRGISMNGNLTLTAGTLKLASYTSLVNTVTATGGNLDFGSGTLRVWGNATFSGPGALTAGTGTLNFYGSSGTQVFTPRSGATHPAVTHTTGTTLQLQGGDLTCASFSQTAGTLDFNGFNLTTVNAGDFSVTGGHAFSFSGLDGRTLAVNGNASLSGASSTSRLNLVAGTGWTLSMTGSGTLTASYATLQNATASGTSGSCSHCANAGGNSGWTFAMAWDGGGGDGKWTTGLNWSGDAQPSSEDAVTFHATSLPATLDAAASVKSITFTSGYTGTFSFSSHTLTINGGGADFSTGGAIDAGTGTLAFTGGGSQTFTPKSGATFPAIHHNSNAGTTTVAGNLTAGILTLGMGTFHLGTGRTHTLAGIAGAGGLDFGTSNLNVTGDVDLASQTLAATSASTLRFTGSSAQSFLPKSTEPDLNLAQAGSGVTTVSANDFTAPTLNISAGTFHLGTGRSHTVTTFSASGGGLDFGSSRLSLTGATQDFSNLGTLAASTGTLAFTGATAKTFTPKATHTYPDIVQNGSSGTTLASNSLTAGALSIEAGTLDLGSSLAHSVASITAAAGGLVFNNSTLNVTVGNADFTNLATLTAGTGTLGFTAPSGTQNVMAKASTTHPHIVHSGAGTLRLNGTTMAALSFLQTAGSFDFNNYDFTTVSSGDFTVNNGNSGSILNPGGRILAVAGNLSLNGSSSTDRLAINPTFAWYVRVSGTANVQHATVRYADASGSGFSTVACTNCSNAGSNSNWTFATSWDGGGGDAHWTTAANWGGDTEPSSEDDVIFNATSLPATLNEPVSVKSITFTSGYTGTFSFSSNTLTINGGGADFSSGGAIDAGSGTLAFTGGGSQTFTPKSGATFPAIHHNSNAGTTTVAGNLTAGVLTLGMGTFHLGTGRTHTLAGIAGAGGLDFGTSNLNVTGDVDLGSQTVTATSTNTLAFTGSAQTFIPSVSEGDLNLTQNGAGPTTVATNNFTTPRLNLVEGTFHLGTGRTHVVTTTLSVTGGGLDFGASTLRTAASTVDFTSLATLTPGTGTLEFSGGAAQTFTPKDGVLHPALVQNGAGGTTLVGNGLQAGMVTLAEGALNLGGGLAHTVSGLHATGGILDFGSSTLRTAGNVNLGGLDILLAGTGTLSFTAASGTQVFVPKNNAVHPLLTHPAAGTVQLSGSSLNARGFDQTAGSLDLNGFDLTLSASGNLAVSGSALPILGLSNRTLTVAGSARFVGTPATKVDLNPASPWNLAVSGGLTAVNARIRNSQAAFPGGVADSSLNLGGNSGWTFVDSIKPDNVTGFLASAIAGNRVALTWTASVSEDADSVMLRYRTDGTYPAGRTDGTLWRCVKADRVADTAAGLPDKAVYHFAAFVKDSSGNYSPASAVSQDSARLPDITPPANVTALVANGLTASTASLAWTPSASADADSVMIRYRAGPAHPAGPADGTLWRMLPGAADRDTLSGLMTNTIYAFSLFVRDSSGNYSPASPAAQDTSLFQIPVAGTVSIGDVSGLTRDGDPALAFTWSGADSVRFSLLPDTAAAAWKAVRAADSLDLGMDGHKVVAAQFKNLYGKRSPWYRDTTLVDRKAPVVALDLKPDLGRWTWPVAVSGKSRDSLSGTDMVFVVRLRLADGFHFNGAAWQAAADTAKLVLSGKDSVFSASLPAVAMTTGNYLFTAYSRDRAGNVGSPVTQAVHYEENRIPARAYSNMQDTVPQNRAVAWRLDFGDLDAGDSLAQVSFDVPAWLGTGPGTDTAWAPWALHKTYALSGEPGQAHVGANVIKVRMQDRGGLILTWADTVHVADVNDAPVWNDSESVYSVKEDESARWTPRFTDVDPADKHTLALLSGPAFAKVEGLSVVMKPGSRDVGEFNLSLAVSDGRLADTLNTVLTVLNVNDKPYAFASTGFPSPAFFKEDRADSFSVVVVDLDRHEPIVFAGQMPSWMKMSSSIDSTGCNRTFTFRVHPTQKDTGLLGMALTFMDPAQAVAQIALAGRILPDNDTPTAVVEDPRTHGGAARFRLSVTDEDGSLEKARFHYRLVGPAGDTIRRGITPSSALSLHPLADGDYRLAVRAEDQDGAQQGAFTVVPFSVSGATALSLDTARWHMLGPQQSSLPVSALGAGATLATWDEAGDDGQPLARYASGKTVESLKRGKGYWVRLAAPLTLAATQKDLLEGPTTLKLTRAKQGWNQVANPYPYWVDVSASMLTFWEWDAQKRDLVNSRGLLKPWAAYWVLAPKDTTLQLADAPYFPSTAGALAKASAAGGMGPSFRHREDWSLQIGLRAGPYHDQANTFGIRSAPAAPAAPDAAFPGAPLPGAAAMVLADAPKFGDYIAFHFEKPAADAQPAADHGYAADFRDRLDPEEEWWDFSVENRGTGETQASLTPSGLEGLAAAGLRLFLVKQGEARLVEPGQAVPVLLEAEKTHYSLVVTPHADFAGRLKGNFNLAQNFPNPVSFQTTFRFLLPQSWDKEGKRVARDFKLRINVYDFAGRQVAQVASGAFRPGSHSLVWRPVSRGGRPLAKGAYVYRLEVPGFTKSLKLLVE